MTLIEARNIGVTIGRRVILDQVGLRLDENQVIGLIGANGAGKTTLLRVLAGLRPADGEVLLLDRRLAGYRGAALARTLAYLPQGGDCHWPLTVEAMVTLGRLPHLRPWQRPNAADGKAVAAAMRATAVDALAERIVPTLSGGERARAMLARALAVEPRVLLADEPVASLDPYHQIQVMELLNSQARNGRGVVVVLHDLALAARFCHRLVLLERGRVLAEGPPRAVLNADNLHRAYGIAARYGDDGGDYYVLPWNRTTSEGEDRRWSN